MAKSSWLDEILEAIFLGEKGTPYYERHITTNSMDPIPISSPITNYSPNFYKGRDGHEPIAIVIHRTGGSLQSCDAWFADPHSQVSAHYGIGKDGSIHHYVHESDTAYHAGVAKMPTWALYNPNVNPNLLTIGIEHEGLMTDIWPEAQLEASAKLIKQICQRWAIPLNRQRVIGHYEIDDVTRADCPAVDKSIIMELVTRAAMA